MKSTPQSITAALDYLRRRGAVHKLEKDVPVLFGCPHHRNTLARSRSRREKLAAAIDRLRAII